MQDAIHDSLSQAVCYVQTLCEEEDRKVAEAHFEAIKVEDVGVVSTSHGPLCMPAIKMHTAAKQFWGAMRSQMLASQSSCFADHY